MKNFAITGVGGYIAPRHLKAIKDTGSNLLAAVDPYDSVGILDQYFPDTAFFTEFERFDRHVEKARRGEVNGPIDYLSICTPNHLHDAHIRFALRVGAHAICEKPLVIKPWNLNALEKLQQETGGKISTILQLRVHPTVVKLKSELEKSASSSKHDICLTYITSRGPWYRYSWKGNIEKSGGLGTNIGIHFFDLLMSLFGNVESSIVHAAEASWMAGALELEKARVRWLLSIDKSHLPKEILNKGQTTYRSIMLDGKEMDLSGGFTDLHTRVYEEIFSGTDFGIQVARPSLELVYSIQQAKTTPRERDKHPFVSRINEGGFGLDLLQA